VPVSTSQSGYRSWLSGERRGVLPALVRCLLLVASGFFRLGGLCRALLYRLGLKKTVRVGRPVISVGNLTAGGTGKTPMVELICERLVERGCKPAIVSRGYGGEPGQLNDEGQLLLRNLPSVPHVQDRDRVRGAEAAIAAGASAIVLDDGFQHWRLLRDADLVLIDATCPFGYGHLLPRGLLREPRSALRRASLILLTRADLAETGALREQIEASAPGVPVGEVVFAPTHLEALSGEPAGGADQLAGAPVLALSAIGNPGAFHDTLTALGARVVGEVQHPDHHAYTQADLLGACEAARAAGATRVVTTQKDAVKLARIASERTPDEALPVLVLRIRAELLAGEAALAALLARLTPSQGAG
jgi:tetraacyldisaccharide 4'-kinase